MPIGRKLLVLMMAPVAVALLVAGIGIVLSDSAFFSSYLQRDIETLVRILTDNTTAALAFDDPKSAEETLAALRAKTHVVAVCIYRDAAMFARYSRDADTNACPASAPPDGVKWSRRTAVASRGILLKGRRIGALVLFYDLGELYERMVLYGATVLVLLIAASIVGFVLASRLRPIIATPIAQLVRTTSQVSVTKDYSIRAPKLSGDELGALVDTFNEMLASIQGRESDLSRALEARGEALRDAQRARDSLATTLASIGEAVISTDVEGRIVLVNRTAQILLGWPEEEMLGKPIGEVFRTVNELTREPAESPLASVLREGPPIESANHTVLLGRDGAETPIDVSAAPTRDASGAILGTVLVFRDVRSRRRAAETSRLLASIVESSDDAIIGHSLDGRITSWNQGAERIFGYPAAEMIGQSAAVIAPAGGNEMIGVLDRIRRGERIEQYYALRCTRSGKTINVSITVSPLFDAFGRIVGASKIARDMTVQVQAAERLAQLNADLNLSNERLARSNEDLERFAFIASHDFQEPLRMIAVYSQLLFKSHKESFGSDAQAFVDNIVDGTRRIRDLLSDLLAYTEVGVRPEETVHELDLNTVLEKATQNIRSSIEGSGAAIHADALPSLRGHEGHFIPLFQNLIGNAIKYRSEKPPEVRISVKHTGGVLRFEIADNGMGIDPQYHGSIFVAFKRLHGKQIPGTGIGLAICQRVVERYGGRIWVESEAGNGSTFVFTLPDDLYVEKQEAFHG